MSVTGPLEGLLRKVWRNTAGADPPALGVGATTRCATGLPGANRASGVPGGLAFESYPKGRRLCEESAESGRDVR